MLGVVVVVVHRLFLTPVADFLTLALDLCDKLNCMMELPTTLQTTEAFALALTQLKSKDKLMAEPGLWFLLGRAFLEGTNGVQKDSVKALHYIQQAADLGHVEAQFQLGLVTLEGKVAGVTQDTEKGIKYLLQAAEEQNAEAQLKMADIYFDGGFGVLADKEKAVAYLKQAADNGSSTAQFRMGEMLLKGRTTDKDKAIHYFAEAVKSSRGSSDGSKPTTERKAESERYLSDAIKNFTQAADKYTLLFLAGEVSSVASEWSSQLEAQSESFQGILHSLQVSQTHFGLNCEFYEHF